MSLYLKLVSLDKGELNLQNRNHRFKRMNLWLQGGDEGCREGIVKEFGTDMHTLLHLKWITNKDLLYSTELFSMLCGSLDGRGVWGRMDTRICTAEPLQCSSETLTTLLICYTQ